MKKLPFLLLTVFLVQCLSACGQHKFNPKAIKLNDSAIALVMNGPRGSSKVDSSVMALIDKPAKDANVRQATIPSDTIPHAVANIDSPLFEKAIGLLNQAIQIDSNYFIAYFNKFGFQCHLKRYQDALATGKKLARLSPDDGTMRYLVGIVYEITGDTAAARRHYQIALALHNKALSAMDTNNKRYNRIKVAKGMDLVMLGRAREAHEIFQALYNAADERYKWEYKDYLTKTRNDFINELKPQGPVIETVR